jgi:hypothetical protein
MPGEAFELCYIAAAHPKFNGGKEAGAKTSDLSCGSACKKDPVSGVIGVQKGPLISMV